MLRLKASQQLSQAFALLLVVGLFASTALEVYQYEFTKNQWMPIELPTLV